MIDVGLYNYVKKGLEEGRTKDEIRATLVRANWKEEAIDEALSDAEHGQQPPTPEASELIPGVERRDYANEEHVVEFKRPSAIAAVCGYFVLTWMLSLAHAGTEFALTGSVTFADVSASLNVSAAAPYVVLFFTVVSTIGYWRMKKWGVYLYTFTVIGFIIFTGMTTDVYSKEMLFSFGTSLIIPFIVIAAGAMHLRDMR